MTGLQAGGEGVFVHNAAARNLDQNRARLIRPSSRRPIKHCVAGNNGTCRVTTSESLSNSSSVTSSAETVRRLSHRAAQDRNKGYGTSMVKRVSHRNSDDPNPRHQRSGLRVRKIVGHHPRAKVAVIASTNFGVRHANRRSKPTPS